MLSLLVKVPSSCWRTSMISVGPRAAEDVGSGESQELRRSGKNGSNGRQRGMASG
jgi:hypothetical protein